MIAAGEEATEHLIVQRVNPLAAKLEGVVAGDDREVVLDVRAPEQFIDVRLQEERIAETETSVAKPIAVSAGTFDGDRRARPQLTRVGEVSFVQLGRRDRREEIDVEIVDLRRAFGAVG